MSIRACAIHGRYDDHTSCPSCKKPQELTAAAERACGSDTASAEMAEFGDAVANEYANEVINLRFTFDRLKAKESI